MDPRDDDELPFDESEDTEPRIRELRTEMVRLQAQIDQLAAATHERAAEIAELRVRLDELEVEFEEIKTRHRKAVRLWFWTGVTYGAALVMGINLVVNLLLRL